MANTSGPKLAGAQAILTIDLGALADNWKLIARRAAPAECAAVVKGDAYGIGLEPAVRTLIGAGCRTFFVANANEGARLRAGLGARHGVAIYVLNGLLPGGTIAEEYIEHGLRPVLGSLEELENWRAAGVRAGAKLAAALHIDTGMNRLGLPPAHLERARALLRAPAGEARAPLEAARTPRALSRVRGDGGALIDLVLSHFVASENPGDEHNEAQIAFFMKLREAFAEKPRRLMRAKGEADRASNVVELKRAVEAGAGPGGVQFSLANSSGVFLPQKPFFDLVRPGYALYGGNPTPAGANPMKPVVRLQAPILELREIGKGETVGYNAQWTAKRPTRLATIGVGYADGLPRNLMATDARAGGEAMVCGRRCSFAGRVSMDLIVLDVTDVPPSQLRPGVMAELLGERITVDDMGARAGTIGYEVLTGLGKRYHRVYVGG